MDHRQTTSADASFSQPILIAEAIEPPRKSKLLLFVGIGAILLVFGSLACLAIGVRLIGMGGVGGRIAGTWVHVDAPPSRAAKALMSVGSEVVSDLAYQFSSFGSVTEKRYGRGAVSPNGESKGSWRLAPEQDGGDDEQTILMEFPGRQPLRMHIRFLDHENAEFRRHGGYPDNFYKAK